MANRSWWMVTAWVFVVASVGLATADHIDQLVFVGVGGATVADRQFSGDPSSCEPGGTGDYSGETGIRAGIGVPVLVQSQARCGRICSSGEERYGLILALNDAFILWDYDDGQCEMSLCAEDTTCAILGDDCPSQELRESCGNAHP